MFYTFKFFKLNVLNLIVHKQFKKRSKNLNRTGFNKFHNFHILNPSIWPLLCAFSFFSVIIGFVHYLYIHDILLLVFGFFQLLSISVLWWDDIIFESFEHTDEIRLGLRIGMILFIVSEIMFFFSFFWAFFHVSLIPGIELGCTWPPIGLENLIISPWGLPFYNTCLLLSSGVTITCAHYYLDFSLSTFNYNLYNVYLLKVFKSNKLILLLSTKKFFFIMVMLSISNFTRKKLKVYIYLILTILLAIIFTFIQSFEYLNSSFFISDGVYGSTFYIMTGFHGFHVLVGTLFIVVCFLRFFFGHFDDSNYVGLECAIWYWHFVDVVWVFLYIFLYVWGSRIRFGGFRTDSYDRIHLLGAKSFPFCSNARFFSYNIFNSLYYLDFPKKYQILFQDPASPMMENIINLHHYIFFYLILTLGFVLWVFFISVYTSMLFYFNFIVSQNINSNQKFNIRKELNCLYYM